jgi:hypothetical protein
MLQNNNEKSLLNESNNKVNVSNVLENAIRRENLNLSRTINKLTSAG